MNYTKRGETRHFWLTAVTLATWFQTSTALGTPATTSSCGYTISSGTYASWSGGYQSWVELTNVDGAVGTAFTVLLDVGNTTISDGYQATFTAADDGYLVTEPSWLQYQKIPSGSGYRFAFVGQGQYQGHTPYLISVNGTRCDTTAPSVNLDKLPNFVTSTGSLVLSATASDDVAVRKVIFKRDGVVVGEDRSAPYEFTVPLDESLNGRHTFSASAVDPSGNEATASASVLVSIANRFVGTAPANAADYEDALTYFNQVTPANAGKWGAVEAERDVMTWEALDDAYEFAAAAGIPFKLHTLVWGQQQPAWLASLPPEEQLTELNEWMAALSERYQVLPLIDVVNEPLHAPPSYAEALGGAGATGYDWVLNAFILARAHFPHAELLLNDYQVLIHEAFTLDYLAIVELLQSEGLIDGISEQAHFLERADVSTVASNLQLLAATGLPIYISEFDVDFADDARHANVFRDLFTTFWEHPSVLGVTHWGHLQGNTWRTNAYLIRQDKSERPALQWLTCYLDGNDDCAVPVYVPSPWIGDEYGVTLQAELYDEGVGILALGDVVAYTDDGDWIGYSSVQFNDTWDTFSVTYAKGNTDAGSLSVHLDSLDNPAVLQAVLAPTGDWGSSSSIDLEWPAVTGAHAVFVRFNGINGVANLDQLRFGKEMPTTGVELVSNGDFETDTAGWYTWNGAISTTSARAHSGSHSLLVSGGSATGPAAIDLLSSAQPGVSYTVSFWVSLGGASAGQVNITRAMTCGSTTTYEWLSNNAAVPSDGWVELTGTLAVPADCDLQMLQVYAEGAAVADLYVDDVSIQGPPPSSSVNLVGNGDFEDNSDGWFSWQGTISTTDAKARTGARSLLTSGPATGPAATDLSAVVTAGTTYNASFWVSVGNVANAQVNLTLALTCGGTTAYSWLANNPAVSSDVWSELSGAFTVPADCVAPGVMLFAEGGGANVDLYVDDVQLTVAP
jgi:endo-1,4-beta-xylanase